MTEIYKCEYCNQELSFEGTSHGQCVGKFAAHKRLCDHNPRVNEIKEIVRLAGEKGRIKARELQLIKSKKQQELNQSTKQFRKFICAKCGKEYQIMLTDIEYTHYLNKQKHFCSQKCSHSRIITDAQKDKVSNSLKNYYRNVKGLSPKLCLNCNGEIHWSRHDNYCSDACKEQAHKKRYSSKEFIEQCRKAGKIRAANLQRRSKNEIAFCTLCEKEFQNVGHNEPIFNGWDADVLLYDFKIAILWNGPWHYKEIFKTGKQTLKSIQNRDAIKLKEISNAGWIPYIIKDVKRRDPDKVQREFDIFKSFLKERGII